MSRAGQHFLADQRIIDRIANYAELLPSDVVLEIGPGTGNLTEALSARAGRVIAIEADPDLARILKGRFSNVEIVAGDALKVDLPEYSKVVSNLPYQISSKITLRLLRRPFKLMVLMYQKEFARRMLASPGRKEYGRISVNVAHYSMAEILEEVPASAFRPEPHVRSAIVRLIPRRERELVDDSLLSDLVRVLFTMRRKKVKRALASMGLDLRSLPGIKSSLVEERPEDLSAAEIVALARAISSACKRVI